MKLCIIGAGAAGLCAAKNGIDFGCEVTIFEQADDIGGTWIYTDFVGKDKNGLDVHTSRYQGLRTNLPKEIMSYPDIPFPEQDKSYILAEDVLDYYRNYVDKFNLRQFIKFEHHVLRVRPMLDDKWEVVVRDFQGDSWDYHTFDAVLVCNGHYTTPRMVNFPGRGDFEGKQIHSHDYRSMEIFKNQKVLIIGAGPSGTDCTIDAAKVADHVTWSHHLEKPPVTNFGSNVIQKPDIMEITKSGARFVDGSHQDYTLIVHCTGYKYTFPFLSVDCGITCEDNYVRPLYKHCLSINRPSLAIIGLPNFVCPSQMSDLQARFCLTFMTGRKTLPSKQEMLKDAEAYMNERREKGIPDCKAHYMGVGIHDKYYEELSTLAEIKPIKPVISKMFAQGLCNLLHDSRNFRNEVFTVLDDENFTLSEKE